ncbi:Crp/Fnr family transcriptional regulator, partial [Burkholderia sp. Ac-20384]|nr:Crp/Fnr family transcriptional regulator [Burkholderia sp. Ac-20384]
MCAMRSMCLPPHLTAAEFGRLDSIICTTRQVRQGDAL